MICEACRDQEAQRRVGFPASPVIEHTFNVCEQCAMRVEDLDGVTNVALLNSGTETGAE